MRRLFYLVPFCFGTCLALASPGRADWEVGDVTFDEVQSHVTQSGNGAASHTELTTSATLTAFGEGLSSDRSGSARADYVFTRTYTKTGTPNNFHVRVYCAETVDAAAAGNESGTALAHARFELHATGVDAGNPTSLFDGRTRTSDNTTPQSGHGNKSRDFFFTLSDTTTLTLTPTVVAVAQSTGTGNSSAFAIAELDWVPFED